MKKNNDPFLFTIALLVNTLHGRDVSKKKNKKKSNVKLVLKPTGKIINRGLK